MRYTIHAKRAHTPAGWWENCLVSVVDGVIQSVASGKWGDFTEDILVPGMIDLHNHGGAGFDNTQPTIEGYTNWTGALARHGVTDVLVTLGTSEIRVLHDAVLAAREAMRHQEAGVLGGARIAGVHLEGPFISGQRPGAMNVAYIQPPKIEIYDEITRDCGEIVKLLSVAPEQPGAMSLVSMLNKRGIRIQAGHTDASFEEGMAAFSGGVGGVCHFFNAMRGIHHREPGLLTAALLSKDIYCELICDLAHIHLGALKMVIQTKGPRRVYLISDASPATGQPDGEYIANGRTIIVREGVSRTPSGTLSGGCKYVSEGARNLIEAGIPVEDTFTMTSKTPAEWMGFTALGAIAPGKAAHLAGLDCSYRVIRTFIGSEIYEAEEEQPAR